MTYGRHKGKKESLPCRPQFVCQMKLNYFFSIFFSLEILSQDWLPTVQLVLQADWQVLLHSPHPVIFLSAGFAMVLIITKYLLDI